MNVQDELKRKQKLLESLKDTSNLNTQRAKLRELRGIHTDGGPASLKIIQEQEGRLKLIEELHDQSIAETEAEIDQMQKKVDNQTAEETNRARAEMRALRDRKREEWVLEGGTKESFERAWPEMEMQILKERVIGTSNQDQGDLRDAIAKKRNMIGSL